MRPHGPAYFLRLGLIVVGIITLMGGGAYVVLNYAQAPPPPEITLPVVTTPSPTSTTESLDSITSTPTATRPPTPTPSPTSSIPPGGIVYALSPDINSVGWVQSGESTNHFGESYIYAGLREGILYHGAIQFDLAFIPDGSTIFMAELELTGMVDRETAGQSDFAINILGTEASVDWARHDFETIHNASIEEALTPSVGQADLGQGQMNKFILNAGQRSIIEEQLDSNFVSIRIDTLKPEQEGWFAWDSGYGEDSLGEGPKLRLGVLPPIPTPVAPVDPAVAEEAATATSIADAFVAGDLIPTGTLVVITSTPTPENVLTAAAIAPALTLEATRVGTPTPLPFNWVTPWAVTSTPTPENTATALFRIAEATAAVIAYGTSTPTPQNMVTATPTPTDTATPIFIVLEGELPPMTPTSTPTAEPGAVPSVLIGKIAFRSDRSGEEQIYIINPDGTGLALLTDRWPYDLAKEADTYSIDGRFRVFTKDSTRYRSAGDSGGGTEGESEFEREDAPSVFWYDALYNAEEELTHFGAGIAYGGVWSPTREQIAFISNDSSDDEIWVVNRDGSDLRQLTESNEAINGREIGKDTFVPEINKDPSWSPDGNQIVFWSTRTGHPQIWVMDRDGSNLYSLSRTGFSDWDPVWIKYPGIPEFKAP